MPRRVVYRGDIGLFRLALSYAGFAKESEDSIFNDDSKAEPKAPTRRLKLWFATRVFDAPQDKQRRLEHYLKKFFGKRIQSMYFVQNSTPYGSLYGAKSLCIKLQDI